MKRLILILFIFIYSLSNAQQQIWKVYIDENNKNEDYTSIYTYQNNRYIFSSTESYNGSGLLDDYIITITKTGLNGDLQWTKSYRPGGQYYRKYTLSNIYFKDTLILIYGSCRDTVGDKLNYIFELNINGTERFSKIFQNVNFIYHANYSDSNTIECIYEDQVTNRKVYSERFNKKYQTILKDSSNTIFNNSYYIINKSKLYLTSIYTNVNNKICLRIYEYDFHWNQMRSDSMITNAVQYQTNLPLYIYPQFKKTITNDFLEISGVYNFNDTETDYYYYEINLNNLTLNEDFNFKKIFNDNYSVNGSRFICEKNKQSVYSLYKVYNKNSLIKYKCKLVKFKNSAPIWNVDLKIPNDSLINITTKLVSLDFINDKILATVSHRQLTNTFVQYIIEFDTNGNYIRSFEDITDTGSSYTINISTIYFTENEILSLAHGKLKGRSDLDIIWKKTSFEPAGYNHHTTAEINPPYPNPTQNILHINCTSCSDIKLYDIYGKLLLNEKNTNEINLEGLSTGVYFLNVRENGMSKVFRVLKQ